MFTSLGHVATVSLGYKSLQNNFFYVNKATVNTYGIEKKFLIPILMLRDLDPETFTQTPTPSLWLFTCREKRADLRGTGAWRYIEAMADRSAAKKKQAGKNLTIQQALEAQGGGLWYSPKARPSTRNIWIRKAINTIYAPFIFDRPALIDQRLNGVSPAPGITWQEVGAILTSSLFAYSLEINGSAAMGAGALEAPTTKLRDYPVLNVQQLDAKHRKRLVELAEGVWRAEAPVDWIAKDAEPDSHLQALDEWLLKLSEANVSTKTLYDDIRAACQARIAVARDKQQRTKKQQEDSVGSVADSIVQLIEPRLKMRNFPDDFVAGAPLDIPFTFDRNSLREIEISHLLDSYDVEIRGSGKVVYSGTHTKPVAEAIVRALLLGRSTFSVSEDREVMDRAVNAFLKWVADTDKAIDEAIAESALGTGYEALLKKEIYQRLGIHYATGAPVLPRRLSL